MSNRFVGGKRGNGDTGLFIGAPGVNAFTAADSDLILNVSNKISQLILLGSVSSNQTISLGLSARPIIFLTTYSNFVLIDESNNFITLNGPTRPSPVGSAAGSAISPVTGAGASATINSSGASFSIDTPGKVTFAVYSKAF